MIPVKQTLRGSPDAPPGRRGNCFGASLASVLEVPMSQIPNPPLECDITVHDSSAWWKHYEGVVAEFGYMLIDWDFRQSWKWMEDSSPGITWLASVHSLNIAPTEIVPEPLHSIVMRDTKVIHDPSRAIVYENVEVSDISHGYIFAALDPAKAGS